MDIYNSWDGKGTLWKLDKLWPMHTTSWQFPLAPKGREVQQMQTRSACVVFHRLEIQVLIHFQSSNYITRSEAQYLLQISLSELNTYSPNTYSHNVRHLWSILDLFEHHFHIVSISLRSQQVPTLYADHVHICWFFHILSQHMFASWNRGTPSSHPFIDVSSLINQPFLGYPPMTMETPIFPLVTTIFPLLSILFPLIPLCHYPMTSWKPPVQNPGRGTTLPGLPFPLRYTQEAEGLLCRGCGVIVVHQPGQTAASSGWYVLVPRICSCDL